MGNYRADIDGLRALAVLSVIGFHAFPSWVPGGFVGVDVFFIISGYLISSIILNGFEQGTFSFAHFYARRIKRIFPALILVLLACYILGWLVLLADENRQLAKHIAAGSVFVSNFVLWRETGYFDIAAELKPLLHLWSLGIEEQFYIVWPLLLFFASRLKISLLLVILLLVGISFAWNIAALSRDSSAAFYLPFSRFWELLIGGGGAYAQIILNESKNPNPATNLEASNSWTAEVLSISGFVLIFAAVFGITRETPYPGWWAGIPTLGALCLIYAGPKASLNRGLLSNPMIVSIGLISYPLYLWHWPILSFIRIVSSETPSLGTRISAIVASFVLAYLTYRFIEKAVRVTSIRYVPLFLSIALASVGTIGYLTYMNIGEEHSDNRSYNATEANRQAAKVSLNTVPEMKSSVSDSASNEPNRPGFVDDEFSFLWPDNQFNVAECVKRYPFTVIDGSYCQLSSLPKPPSVAVIGDSHANAIFGTVEYLLRKKNISTVEFGKAGCPPFLGVEREKNKCPELMRKVIDYVKSNKEIRYVILAGRFTVTQKGPKLASECGVASQTREDFYKLTLIENSHVTDRNEIFAVGLDNILRELTQSGKKVILLGQVPDLNFDPKFCTKERGLKSDCTMDKASVDACQADSRSIIGSVIKHYPETLFLDLLPYFCRGEKCYVKYENHILYRDFAHIGSNGTAYLSRVMTLPID